MHSLSLLLKLFKKCITTIKKVQKCMRLQINFALKRLINCFFGLADMLFPGNGILLIQGNLPRVFLVLTFNYASFLSSMYNDQQRPLGATSLFKKKRFSHTQLIRCHGPQQVQIRSSTVLYGLTRWGYIPALPGPKIKT